MQAVGQCRESEIEGFRFARKKKFTCHLREKPCLLPLMSPFHTSQTIDSFTGSVHDAWSEIAGKSLGSEQVVLQMCKPPQPLQYAEARS